MHGAGKTTFGERIATPLVGMQNSSFPDESDVLNERFNECQVDKRLVVIAEVYAGHSWKMTEKLKKVATDQKVRAHFKNRTAFTTDNWCRVIASSNSPQALKLADEDRRWYYPEVTEKFWPHAKFVKLNKWLEGGGLSIILHWAENYGDYVQPGVHAPMTERKKQMIAESRSAAMKEVTALAEEMNEWGAMKDVPLAFAIKDVRKWAVDRCRPEPVFDNDLKLRKVMCKAGVTLLRHRPRINGFLQDVLLNDHPYWKDLGTTADDKASDLVRAVHGKYSPCNVLPVQI